ncbi:hypothetical protein GGI12_004271 [Dipsacomyces acuminosporus]|nr:hypothetical protein GGI12_004271 [Dipsacomyces acuminosporus]
MADFLKLVVLSFLASGACEAISYYLVYRTEQFQLLKQTIIRNEAKLDEENRATAGNAQRRQRRIESIEAQLNATRTKASRLQLRTTLLTGILQLVFVYVVNSIYASKSVGTLPFVPISMFRSLTHRGLPDDSPSNACSATFVFVLGGLAFKALIDKSLKLGVPKGSSLPKWVTNPEDVIGVKK